MNQYIIHLDFLFRSHFKYCYVFYSNYYTNFDGYCININEEEIDIKLFNFIKLAHKDNSVLREIVQKQKNHKTHFVFDKLYKKIKTFKPV